jgi:SAM-dependent methyltransferase
MSGFSADWLALREPADHRARNRSVAQSLSGYFAQRQAVHVVDLGCGAGSNLRATSELLPETQHWTLVDYDPLLLEAARLRLIDWADAHDQVGGDLVLRHGRRTLTVVFRQANLVTELETVLGPEPTLVTAAALFDLASLAFIQQTARAVVARGAVFYTALTYNGVNRWSPRRPADNAMVAAFNQHQMTDKGFGPAAGPTAPSNIADAFRIEGYTVEEGESPWELGPADASLIRELATGFANAVKENRGVDVRTINGWLDTNRTGAYVGHTDTLARPR